jgi:hypothetical protein
MMRYLSSFLAIFCLANVVLGQESPLAPGNVPEQIISPETWAEPQRPASRGWVDAEYLLWHISNGPLPIPVLTTGNPVVLPAPGAIGQPSTSVLLGNSSMGYGSASGLRVNMGGWLNGDNTIGLEAGGFFLGQRTFSSSVASGSNNIRPLYIPIFEPDLGREGSYTIADPLLGGGTVGSFSMTSTSSLWSAEGNGLLNLYRGQKFNLDALVGFRYFDLSEAITIKTNSLIVASDNGLATRDHFGTHNEFSGGQLGLRAEYEFGRFSLNALAKVALGDTYQILNVNGSSTTFGAGAAPAAGTYPGGIFAQTSNSGRSTHNAFSVSPQVGLKANVKITERLRGFVGYDFLYWSNVARPGNQMDHAVNLTQGQIFGPPAVGDTSRPAIPFNNSGFIAQGVSFGLEFRF